MFSEIQCIITVEILLYRPLWCSGISLGFKRRQVRISQEVFISFSSKLVSMYWHNGKL